MSYTRQVNNHVCMVMKTKGGEIPALDKASAGRPDRANAAEGDGLRRGIGPWPDFATCATPAESLVANISKYNIDVIIILSTLTMVRMDGVFEREKGGATGSARRSGDERQNPDP
jgi:hypothetical protein